jgi:hypothetical protein
MPSTSITAPRQSKPSQCTGDGRSGHDNQIHFAYPNTSTLLVFIAFLNGKE